LAQGYKESADDRSNRDAIHTNGNPGRAPSLGDIANGSGEQGTESGMEESEADGPESDQQGDKDQDGEGGSLLDKRIF
jgi:hypothetical protein